MRKPWADKPARLRGRQQLEDTGQVHPRVLLLACWADRRPRARETGHAHCYPASRGLETPGTSCRPSVMLAAVPGSSRFHFG